MKKITLLIIAGVIGLLFPARVEAFGVSPAEIFNDSLKPGARIEKTISLSRSDPSEEEVVIVEPDLGEMDGWFKFEPGKQFSFPKGKQEVFLKVLIDVPNEARLDKFHGVIRVKATPKTEEKGGVSVVKGARMDVDLITTSLDLSELLVRAITVEEAQQDASGKVMITAKLKIENKGNVDAAPSRVIMEVSDLSQNPVTTLENYGEIERIKPAETKEVNAYFRAELGGGEYLTKVKVMMGDKTLREEGAVLRVKGLDQQTSGKSGASNIDELMGTITGGKGKVIGVLALLMAGVAITSTVILGKNKKKAEKKLSLLVKALIVLAVIFVTFGIMAIKSANIAVRENVATQVNVKGETTDEQPDNSEVKGISIDNNTVTPPISDKAFRPMVVKGLNGESIYPIYQKADFKSKVVYNAKEGDKFDVIEERSDWYRVEVKEAGVDGWLPKGSVTQIQQRMVD